MTEFPQSEMRIGDAEREDGLRALGEHMSAGRLTVDEYGDRSAKATTATTRGELMTLFVDLPDPRPRFGPPAVVPAFAAPPAYARRPPPAVRRMPNVLVPIAVVVGAFLFFRFGLLPLLLLPLIVMMFSGRRHHAGRGWH
ncbi:protein of unknown function DUF1707 [Alloactinosynnema sp. L-07]|uniref:DUF1707 SHOCT-like domain-containing protein n=1 Tax=Alloactinosynnema sp. L-07 TaxID=1653480 RepID=UPI00065EFD81|nr:DUF1707 domain-containing protein [Alloactinosynnema sp. L-07]CRK59799.1 protein of unknown function DUF1707 [Alloactinosynnema sp. L-07]